MCEPRSAPLRHMPPSAASHPQPHSQSHSHAHKPAGSVLPLEHLEQVQAAAAAFAAAAFAALSRGAGAGALAPADFAPAHKRVLAPAEEALLQYGDRELAYLGAELARIASKGEPIYSFCRPLGGCSAVEGTVDPPKTQRRGAVCMPCT